MAVKRLLLRTLHGVRRAWFSAVWGSAVKIWCRLEVRNVDRVPDEAVVIVANHASHADTVLLQHVLARSHRRPLLVAGAEDYWFRNPIIGGFAAALGVFPFPRKGQAGVERTRHMLNCRSSVILYPQGTRGGGPFRPGIGRIVSYQPIGVVPVYIDGSADLLPKGRWWPRRSDVVISFGRPTATSLSETPDEFAARLQACIDSLGQQQAA